MDGTPTTLVLVCRRYRCIRCGAVLLVVPRGIAPRKHYGFAAIAMALALRLIPALTPDDTAEYLRMRLTRVAVDREVFSSDAVVLLHEATAGAMRDLDRLCAAALREAARKKRKLVERDVVARVIEADIRDR